MGHWANAKDFTSTVLGALDGRFYTWQVVAPLLIPLLMAVVLWVLRILPPKRTIILATTLLIYGLFLMIATAIHARELFLEAPYMVLGVLVYIVVGSVLIGISWTTLYRAPSDQSLEDIGPRLFRLSVGYAIIGHALAVWEAT